MYKARFNLFNVAKHI